MAYAVTPCRKTLIPPAPGPIPLAGPRPRGGAPAGTKKEAAAAYTTHFHDNDKEATSTWPYADKRERRTTSSSPTSPSPRGQLRHCPWLLAPAAPMWKWLIRTHSASLRRLESGWRHVEEKRRHATAGGGRNLPFGDPTRDAASGSPRPPQNKTNSCPRQQATRLRTASTLPSPASAGRQHSATGGNGR
eukprot:scaffold2303_cov113-Isochrysis_galbana.AAC.4